jgi:hypothetical protein
MAPASVINHHLFSDSFNHISGICIFLYRALTTKVCCCSEASCHGHDADFFSSSSSTTSTSCIFQTYHTVFTPNRKSGTLVRKGMIVVNHSHSTRFRLGWSRECLRCAWPDNKCQFFFERLGELSSTAIALLSSLCHHFSSLHHKKSLVVWKQDIKSDLV